MTDFGTHPTFEQLSDHLDHRLAQADHRAIEIHLVRCSVCAARFGRLDAVRASARSLGTDTEPPADLWRDIEARITQTVPMSPRMPTRFWRLAAAAVVLVALSSGVTVLIVRRPTAILSRPAAIPVTSATLTGSARAVDADYASAIRELNETLATRRPALDPVTIAKVEASLRVIDLAIVEARHALAGDPANRTLIDLLAASYERKVELLRRANELPPST
jgi:anti-sigma factor RsiW